MNKKFLNQLLTFGIVAVAFFIVVLIGINITGNEKIKIKPAKSVEALLKDVKVTASTPRKASVELGNNSLASELPEISKYPLSVEGKGKVDVEIFATSEKSGSGTDGWINDVAKKFNSENKKLSDGSTVSVSIRPMSSGLGSDYIISKKYLPDAYTPSNSLFGDLTYSQGGEVTLKAERLIGNVAGMLLSNEVYDKINAEYKSVDIKTVTQATADNKIIMGYTNPLSSATGLNFLMSTLSAYDSGNILSETAAAGFTAFQKNVPYVAYTTLQMRDSAKNGSLTGMVLEYQLYVNDKDLNRTYKFIPFGIRHDNPLYKVGVLSTDKEQALDMFLEYCNSQYAQNLATEYGFNGFDEYKGITGEYTGTDIIKAQKLWKTNKDSGKDIIAVFIADCSGSMSGEPINQLRQSLINGSQYINENNYIGLISYSNDVNIDLPIGKFDLNQRAYFQGAVEDLMPGGGTASYDAVAVGLKMIKEAKAQNPQAKAMLFLLSDGQSNLGNTLKDIEGTLVEEQIPVYTISYGESADVKEMTELSNINEAAAINADSDDIVYKIKSLFNAQM